MPVAYVTEPGASIHKQGQSLLVVKDGQQLAEWELVNLSSLVLLGPVNITTPAMTALLEAGIETAFLTSSGKLLGQLTPPKPGNVQLRLNQYRLAQEEQARLIHARAIVAAKITAMRAILDAYADNYPELALDQPRSSLRQSLLSAENASGSSQLLGIEGTAAATYWAAFRLLNRSQLPFEGRSARPPRDPVNAMLSFGYVLLVNEIWALLDALGYDPFLGFYHAVAPNRPSLALDLVEPFRHSIIDRFVLRAINLGQFKADDFQAQDDGSFRMSRDALRRFIGQYERAMQSLAYDPLQSRRIPWRDIVRRRCERLAVELARDLPEPACSASCFCPAPAEEEEMSDNE